MNEVFGHPWLSQAYASLQLGAAVPALTNEIKAYLAASVLDDRKADAHWFQRRIPVIRYLVEEGANLLQHFGAACLADIAARKIPVVTYVTDVAAPLRPG